MAEPENSELPIVKTVVSAQRWTRAIKKMLRDWPHPTVKVPCDECKAWCVIAQSTEDIRKASEEWIPVNCEECLAAKNVELICEPSEGQIKEEVDAFTVIDLKARSN